MDEFKPRRELKPRDRSQDIEDPLKTEDDIERANMARVLEAELKEIAEMDPERLQLLVIHRQLKSYDLLEEIAGILDEIRDLLTEETDDEVPGAAD